MSTLLQDESRQDTSATPAQRLRTMMAAIRLSCTWFGVRKSLSAEQKAQAADAFGAEGSFLSAGKKLLDTRDPAFKAVTAVKNRATSYLKGISLPFPEPGIRLIRQDDLDEINGRMRGFREELEDAVVKLNRRFDSLKDAARQRLGSLYNESDYPATLHGLFDMAWDFPSVEPPDYLRQLNPQVYEEECRRMQARFDEAVRLAEAAFTEELGKLVDHLAERLTGGEDGKPKVFRDSAVNNLREFFERFGTLNVRSSEDLDNLVARAQGVLGNNQPQDLRDNRGLRKHVAAQLSSVQARLDQLLVDRPRRKVLRRAK